MQPANNDVEPGKSYPISDALPSWVPSLLRYPRSAWKTLAVAPFLTLGGAFAIQILLISLLPGLTGPQFPKVHWAILFFLIVILSPLIETLFIAGAFAVSRKYLSVNWSVITTTIICAALHSAKVPSWGLVIWWPFLVFVLLYAVWKQVSFGAGIAMATFAHALNNLPTTVALILSQQAAG